MIGRDRIDDESTASLTDARSDHARLERRYVTVKRPGEIQRRVAFKRQALSLRRFAGV